MWLMIVEHKPYDFNKRGREVALNPDTSKPCPTSDTHEMKYPLANLSQDRSDIQKKACDASDEL